MSVQPLPPPLKPEIESLVFTHRSLHVKPANVIEDPEEPKDWERLAFLGEGIFFAAVSNVLYRTYPRHRTSYLKPTRLQLMSKESLASIADAYKWMESIRCPPNSRSNIQKSLDNRASLAESYVAGVALSHGIDRACQWAEDLLVWKHDLPIVAPTLFDKPVALKSSDIPSMSLSAQDHIPQLAPHTTTPATANTSPVTSVTTSTSIPTSYVKSEATKTSIPTPTSPTPRLAPPATVPLHALPNRPPSPPPPPPPPIPVYPAHYYKPPQHSQYYAMPEASERQYGGVLPHTVLQPQDVIKAIPSLQALDPMASLNLSSGPDPSPVSSSTQAATAPAPVYKSKVDTKSTSGPGYLARLNEASAKRCRKIEWDFSSDGQGQWIVWTARISVRNSFVASATGQSKQVAKEAAAKVAIETLGWEY